MKKPSVAALFLIGCIAIPGCRESLTPPAHAPKGGVETVGLPTPVERPLLVVNKNPQCGCCELWIGAMQRAGFDVEAHDVDNLDPLKTRLGIPVGKGSCHTARIDGYFIEGHVPADDIKRLLAEHPAAKGLVAPGMPMGAPGMEVPDGSVHPYTVELVRPDGSTEVFAQHGLVAGDH